jgi:hypothetical protein
VETWKLEADMRKLVASLTICAIVLTPAQGYAWGFEAHRFILEKAIGILPPEIRPFFERYRVAIVEHSIDPDLWRTVGWDAEEGPRHFLDMDAYGPHPFKDLPREYDAAVKRYGAEFVKKNGLLPWRAGEMHGKLVEAFTLKQAYSRENIKLFSSVIGHYLSDAHVPFHAALNHDGQLTGQWGIHSRFESELFERYRDKLQIPVKPLVKIGNMRDFAFDTLVNSFTHVQTILDADKTAVAGREVYDDAYFAMMFDKLKPVLEDRLAQSVTAVASAIAAAWEEAGKPALPPDQPRTLRKVRRQ